jgi:uncharacterized protein
MEPDRQSETKGRERLAPQEPLPPYAYVTGRFPHPTRDPAGHSFGAVPMACSTPDPNRWRDCPPYLFGVDLFNHGYYWEAHEAWEAVWNACGRSGIAANFIKGLIKLAAAGVKIREGRPPGARTHAQRAAELFQSVAEKLPPEQTRYFGLSLPWLVGISTELAGRPLVLRRSTAAPVEIVFEFVLQPDGT